MNVINYDGREYSYYQPNVEEILEWRGVRDMFHSCGGFKDGSYLIPFPRESTTSTDENGNPQPNFFKMRKDLAHYENIFQPELLAKINPIFAKDQIRKVTGANSNLVEDFISNPTNSIDETLSDYQRMKLIDASIYGSIFEICDSNETTETGTNNSESIEYVHYVTPLDIYGYGLDNSGCLELVLYYEDIDYRSAQNLGITTSYLEMKDSDDKNYLRGWVKTDTGGASFLMYNNEIIQTSIITFDVFPVALFETNTRYDKNKIAKSAYLSELSICKKIYNITSWYNDSFVKNCFAILTYNGRIPDDLDLGNNSMLEYPLEGANAPSFIAPPIGHLDIEIREVERLVKQLQMNMNSTVAISAMASGDSRKEADKRRIEQLKQSSKDLQDSEIWLINVALRSYLKNPRFEYIVLYPKDFETLTKADEIDPLLTLLSMGMKQEVSDQIKADAIRIVYSNNPDRAEELAKMQIELIETTENDSFETTEDDTI